MHSQSNLENLQAARVADRELRQEEHTSGAGQLKKLCIYHGNCADGFGAAWVVRKALGKNNVEFVAGVYQTEPPDVTGRDVIMVDFSYKRAVMHELLQKAKSLVLLDHHKSAMEDLVNLDLGAKCPVIAHFDLQKSGAMLAWDFYFNGHKPPELLRCIEDRDLWRFKLPYTREVQACVFSYPYDFEVWDKLMFTPLPELYAEGIAIERKHFKDIEELLKVCQRRLNIAGYNVPAASLPYTMSSDAGHIMGKGEPFAACYYDTPAGRCFSLRSAEDGVDVSEIAKVYGGGGHKHAAGFTAPLYVARNFELDVPFDLTYELNEAVKTNEPGTYNFHALIHKKATGTLYLSNMMLTKGAE